MAGRPIAERNSVPLEIRMVRRLRIVRRLIIETAATANPALNAEVIQADLANVTDKSPTQKNAELLKKIQYDANTVEDDDDIKGQRAGG